MTPPRLLALGALLALAAAFAWLGPRLAAPPGRAALALRALESGRAEEAAILFEAAEWRGVAEHRAGRHLSAAAAFLEEETPERLYNAGVAYARLHQWGAARAAFEKALRHAPGHADARWNLDVVARAEAAERELAEAAAAGAEPAGRAAGDLRSEPAPGGDGGAGETRPGDAAGGAATPTASEAERGGAAAEAGRPGAERRAADPAGGPAGGAPEAEAPTVSGASAAVVAARRESAIEAEILFRRIRDDPERALRGRLRAANELRRARESGR